MSQRHEGNTLSGEAGAAIARFLRVKLSSGQWAVAGDEASLGTMEGPALASGDRCSILLRNAPGTRIYIAGGAIAAGAETTSAANGKVVTGTAGVEDLGTALTAATADGDEIEVLPPL